MDFTEFEILANRGTTGKIRLLKVLDKLVRGVIEMKKHDKGE